MKNKIRAILLVILLIISIFIPVVNSMNIPDKSLNVTDEKTRLANVIIKKYDAFGKSYHSELIKQITIEDAEAIKNELLAIQLSQDNTEEIIRNQFEVMHRWGILNSEIDYDDFEKILLSNNRFSGINFPSISTGVTILGPSIVSFLTLGSIIFPLHMLFWDMLGPVWWNATILNFDAIGGSSIAAQLMLSPALAVYSSAMTFINCVGLVIGPKFMFSPFASMLVGVAGLIITANIYTDSFAMNVFDWSAGFCIAGLIAYISQIEP